MVQESCYTSKMEAGKRKGSVRDELVSKSLRERYLKYFTYLPNEYSPAKEESEENLFFLFVSLSYACHLHNDRQSMRGRWKSDGKPFRVITFSLQFVLRLSHSWTTTLWFSRQCKCREQSVPGDKRTNNEGTNISKIDGTNVITVPWKTTQFFPYTLKTRENLEGTR